jgi:hypothetical protein
VYSCFLSKDCDWKKGIRHFTHEELEKLQTVPVGYTNILNKNKAWDLIGDGWTVEVIAHIFSFLQ